ncbi:MAG: purine-binding chemotaxis protein CheW [Fidelibacterota bacterium]|nr:MAG: purine-binding chemotaxis protein CheW [Candidatus Neomarinimicrobiota bacterium]
MTSGGFETDSHTQEPALSSSMENDEAKGVEETVFMVTFQIACQTYGGDILQIQEVTRLSAVTWVPHLQPCIRGVSNLRGSIVPIVDLGIRLGLRREDGKEGHLIMIARTDQGLIGYIVDSVSGVVPVSRQTIEPTPEGWMDGDHKYYAGVVKLEEKLVSIVDFSNLIQTDQVLLDEVRLG